MRGHDDERDRAAHQRVGERPAGHDDQRGGHHHAHGAQRVAEHLEVRRANVEARLGGAVQQPGAREIHDEPDGGDAEHGTAENRRRRQEPPVGLEQDPAGDDE